MKSSFCDTSACIEVEWDHRVWIRNTTDPDTWVSASRVEWLAFVAGVRNGDFDSLLPAIPPEGQP